MSDTIDIESWLDLDPTPEAPDAGGSDGSGAAESAVGAETPTVGEQAQDRAPDATGESASASAQTAESAPDAERQQAPGAEPEVVLTADGRHALPYRVLQQERQAAAAQRAETQRLQQELDALRAQVAVGQAPAVQQQPAPELPDYRAALDEAIASGDKPLEALARAGLAGQQAFAAQQARIDRLENALAVRERSERERTARTVAQSIEQHPDMALWLGTPALLERAQQVEAAMLAVPGSALGQFAAAGDFGAGYWSALAAATVLAYPDMPRATAVQAQPSTVAPRAPARQAEAPNDPLPTSISSIPGGIDPTATPPQTIDDLGRLPQRDQARVLREWRESGTLFDRLDGLPVGALNAR